MTSKVIFNVQPTAYQGFEYPQSIDVDAKELQRVCAPLRQVLAANPQLESLNIQTHLLPLTDENDFMGWDLLAFAMNENEICLALQDVNGATVGYQAQLEPGFWV